MAGVNNEFFDALEARSPAQREAEQMAALPKQVAHAQAHSAAFAEILKGVDAATINSRAALAHKVPIITTIAAARATGVSRCCSWPASQCIAGRTSAACGL